MHLKRRKGLSVFLVGLLGFSSGSALLPMPLAHAVESTWNSERYGNTIDVDMYLENLSEDPAFMQQAADKVKNQADGIDFNTASATRGEQPAGEFTYDGGTKLFLDFNLTFQPFTLRSVGENVEVWVAEDVSYPMDDPRETPVITQEQVDYLRDEFERNIYPTATSFFGFPDKLDGTTSYLEDYQIVPENYYTGSDKIMLMVDNVKDQNYYDPSYPNFVAGFFWQTLELYTGRNMITVDTLDWDRALESVFFSTTIHELQHLIHADNDPAEETWLNEGMSTFAEYLGGYGHNTGAVNYFLDHPENSLVNWDEHLNAPGGPETIADYGQVYLFTLYMHDRYGQEFIRQLALNQGQGIASVEETLQVAGAAEDFTQLYQDFIAAMVIDDDRHGNPHHNFASIDLRELPVDRAGTPRGYTVNFENAQLFEKEGVPAWGGDFKLLAFDGKIDRISFDGIDFLPQQWQQVADPLAAENLVFWSNDGEEADNTLVFAADLTNTNTATLRFDHLLQIEETWDYGFVQVSTDGGQTWTSLGNEHTRTDVPEGGYPAIQASLPGFTGMTSSWQQETFDLSRYAGQEILLSFRYRTDWAHQEQGWFIDNLSIPEIGYYNDGASTAEFRTLDQVTGNYVEYTVTFINEKMVGKGKGAKANYKVIEVDPFNVTDQDALTLRQLFKDGNNYMIVSYAAPRGQINPLEFSYEIHLK